MIQERIVAGIVMDEQATISIIEVCQQCRISESTLVNMMEHGLFKISSDLFKSAEIDQQTFSRISKACRLQQDLGVNIEGAVLVMELLDELEQAREELRILQRHVMR